MALSSDEVRKLREELEAAAASQKKLQTSVSGLVGQYSDIYKLAREIADAKQKNATSAQKILDIEAKIASDAYSGKILDDLKDELKIRNKIVKENNDLIYKYEQQYKLLQKQAFSLKNIASSIGGSIYKGLKANWKEFQEFDKAARSTALSMGMTGDHLKSHIKSYEAVKSRAADLGWSVGDLAKAQGRYSDNLGRAVNLSNEGLLAITQISESTLLGAEGAADIAAAMDNFGMSATAARDAVQETVDLAQKMGLNSTKVVKIMQDNLKMANKYNFKEGTKNIAKMAALTAKFKLEMSDIGSMADKLFEPEGAIEMAANLQVLGGEFSKLADPFKLMFMARNDMEGLHEAVIKATAGIATFNKETGEFNVSAQELHRLKYVAEATGIPMEELVKTAKEYAKVDMTKKQIGADIDPEFEEFITSSAQWNKDKGGMTVTIVNADGKRTEMLVKDLDNKILAANKQERATLEQRAKDSQTFDETLSNLILKLKSSLLPLLERVATALKDPLDKLINYLNNEKVIEKLSAFAAKIGDFAAGIIKFMVEEPVWAAAIGGGIILAVEAADWFIHGVALGMGFNSVANVGGGFGGPSGGRQRGGPMGRVKNLFKGKGKGLNSMPKGASGQWGGKTYKGGQMLPKGVKWDPLTKTLGKGGWKKTFGTFGKGSMGLGMGGIAVDLLNQGLIGGGAYREGSGWDKGLGILGNIGEYAGLGSMVGPWGTLAGAIFGAGKGIWDAFQTPEDIQMGAGFSSPDMMARQRNLEMANDFISRPGEGLTKINSSDTLVGAKSGGPIDKLLSGGQNMIIEFKPLKIEFSPLELKSGGNSLGRVDFEKDPQLIRELSRIIQEEVRSAIGGGKLSPNVSK